eukprot:11194121-Lingulodinium_polyedra.AAC.1
MASGNGQWAPRAAKAVGQFVRAARASGCKWEFTARSAPEERYGVVGLLRAVAAVGGRLDCREHMVM